MAAGAGAHIADLEAVCAYVVAVPCHGQLEEEVERADGRVWPEVLAGVKSTTLGGVCPNLDFCEW